MLREQRKFVILKLEKSWAIAYVKKLIKTGFKTKEEAESYKSFLKSR